MRDAVRDLRLFSHCTTVQDSKEVLHREIELEVDAMNDLMVDADAFDVIELMRMREFSPVPDPRVISPDGSALAVEIVTAILLARPTRKPHPRPRRETRPHEKIDELHRRSKRLGRLALYRTLVQGHLSSDPMAQLAAQYQGAVINIRNLQYKHIRRAHEARLFDNPVVQSLMERYLGYSYPDLLSVRSAMTELSGRRITALRDGTGDIVMKYQGRSSRSVTRRSRGIQRHDDSVYVSSGRSCGHDGGRCRDGRRHRCRYGKRSAHLLLADVR
jgi:hypothetical protein